MNLAGRYTLRASFLCNAMPDFFYRATVAVDWAGMFVDHLAVCIHSHETRDSALTCAAILIDATTTTPREHTYETSDRY